MLSAITRLFPLWALLLSITRVLHPHHIHRYWPVGHHAANADYLGMGVHLKIDDFKRVLSRPAPVAADLPPLPGDAACGVAAGDGL